MTQFKFFLQCWLNLLVTILNNAFISTITSHSQLESIVLMLTYKQPKGPLYTWSKSHDHENPRALENHPKVVQLE